MTKQKQATHLIRVPPVSISILTGNEKRRRIYCPVRGKMDMAYEVPIEKIDRLIRDQARINDCNATDVEEKARDMAANGQETAIMVDHKGYMIYGNTRFRAKQKNDAEAIETPDCRPGHIWTHVHFGTPAEARKYALQENANQRHQTPATKKDIAYNLKKMIGQGDFDTETKRFVDLTDSEQRTAIKNWCLKEIPVWGGKKFRAVWNILRKSVLDLEKKFRTWDKNELCDYFLSQNPYGITTKMWKEKQQSGAKNVRVIKDTFSSGEIFETPNHGKVAVWFIVAEKEIASGTLKASSFEKIQDKKADKVVVVAAFNEGATNDTVDDKRTSGNNHIVRWNDRVRPLIPSSIAHILYVPQKESEQNLIIKGKYAAEQTWE